MNSSIRRTESYLTKIKSCCRVVSRSKSSLLPFLKCTRVHMYSITLDGFQFLIVCVAREKTTTKKTCSAFSNDSHGRRIAINLRKCVVAFLSLKWYRTTIVSRIIHRKSSNFVSNSARTSILYVETLMTLISVFYI